MSGMGHRAPGRLDPAQYLLTLEMMCQMLSLLHQQNQGDHMVLFYPIAPVFRGKGVGTTFSGWLAWAWVAGCNQSPESMKRVTVGRQGSSSDIAWKSLYWKSDKRSEYSAKVERGTKIPFCLPLMLGKGTNVPFLWGSIRSCHDILLACRILQQSFRCCGNFESQQQ